MSVGKHGRATGGMALTVSVVALAAGCTGAATSPSPTVPPTAVVASPVTAAPATAAPTSSAPGTSSPAATTPTDFGPIRDAVPGSLPLPPDLQPADLPGGPFSGAYTTPMPVTAVADAIAAGLAAEGWTAVTSSGPTEAGEVTIDATGTAADCRVRVSVAPLGGLTAVAVLYAAACPAE